MATATSPQPVKSPNSKWRITGYGLLALLAIIILVFAYNFAFIKGQAKLGASYASHIVCSCRYIEGRDLKSCEGDFEDGMEIVSVSDDPEHQRITATVPLLAKAMSERRSDFGCLQLNEAEMDAID